jgi:hypothetical protein
VIAPLSSWNESRGSTPPDGKWFTSDSGVWSAVSDLPPVPCASCLQPCLVLAPEDTFDVWSAQFFGSARTGRATVAGSAPAETRRINPPGTTISMVGSGITRTAANDGLGFAIKLRNQVLRGATPLSEAEGNTGSGVTGEPLSDPAQSETLHTRGNSSHGNREVPTPPEGNTGRPEKATSRTSGTHGVGKSEGGVVPKNPSNNGGLVPPVETGQGRPPAEGNTSSDAASRTQSRGLASTDLERVREVARKDRKAKFTALLHHITIPLLFESCFALKRGAAPGIDG